MSVGKRAGKPCIAVEDSGPGIPENERERVRQRFYRLPNSPGHGSGLGLAIVDEIAGNYDAASPSVRAQGPQARECRCNFREPCRNPHTQIGGRQVRASFLA